MKTWHWMFGIVASFILVLPVSAQDPQGNWQGALTIPRAGQLQLVVHIQKTTDTRYTGVVDSPDQGASGIPLGSIALEGNNSTFNVPSIGGAYRGTWVETQDQWHGEWAQGGARFALDLVRSRVAPQGPFAGLGGDWDASLEVGPQRLRLVLHIRIAATGTDNDLGQPRSRRQRHSGEFYSTQWVEHQA